MRVLTRRMWGHIGPRRRRQVAMVCGLMAVSGFFEIMTLGAIVPFLGILASPGQFISHPVVAQVASVLGVTTPDQLALPLAALFAGAATAAAGVRLLLLWSNDRLATAISGDFAVEVYRRTLYQPYSVHVHRNSSSILSAMTQKIEFAVRILMAQLTVATNGVQMIALASALVVVNPVVAGVATVSLGSGYALLVSVARRRLRVNGQLISDGATRVIKVIQEGLGGIRDVLLVGAQPLYAEEYRKAHYALRRAQNIHTFVANAPRFTVEAFGITLVAMLGYWMSREPGGLGAALPVLGVLALGAQRMFPLWQMAYSAWALMMGSVPSVSEVMDLLDQPLPAQPDEPPPAPLGMRRAIHFESVRFRYTSKGPWVLNGLTLSIEKGVRMGIIGETGSGKSTFSDLLMGLLEPTDGSIAVDGQALSPVSLRAWQRSIAHVPQAIYLSDSSIADNIAFGIRSKDIDMTRVRHVAAQAHIAEFIESLPDGYLTTVGERGIRLSGGQRQRIGIARALYRRPSVFVLDEATSALDNATEQTVMETIEALDRDLTIVVIAHRLTTLRRCDRLFELIGGRAVEYESYQQMVETSPCASRVVAVS